MIVLKETVGKQIPPGTHIAICYRIVFCGTQPDSGFGPKKKLVISWELPHERVQWEGKEMPMSATRFYTIGASGGMNKKSSLRKDLSAWRGRDFTPEELQHFELKAILGKGCQVVVEQGENGKSKVVGVVGLPKGMKTENPINPMIEYSIEDGKEVEAFKALPEWLQNMCSQCLEWTNPAELEGPKVEEELPPEPDDSDVPF